jgi:glutamine amidotransferase
MKVLIIDYGMGNVGSVKRSLEECGAENIVISHYESDFDDCTHAILPGVGAFAKAMQNLHEGGLVKLIQKIALQDKVPFLGICLGMQLLADKGYENSPTEGLGIIPGEITELIPGEQERVPHVGWNEINIQQPSHPILKDIKDHSDFYFVHSYHFSAANPEHILAQTPYCKGFSSMVAKDNIVGTQFHPEKSSTSGFKVLRNFLSM